MKSELETLLLPSNQESIALASKLFHSGQLVAFPTETVYGLGANVYDAKAVANIFAAKERPHFDPLISHIAEVDFLKEYAQTDERVMALAKHLPDLCLGFYYALNSQR